MKISRNDCSAALFLFLAGVGPLAAMTEPCLPLPNQLTVTFEYATTLDLSNVNVATSENGAFNFTNIETPEPLFLPSPPLAGLASQLSSCQAEIVIGGSSVLPVE
jgi:hypothetical protein